MGKNTAFQDRTDKNFGQSSYFRDKDNMRNAVNQLRQEDRQKRITASLLRRNIKKSLRDGQSPNDFITAGDKLGIDLKSGGLGGGFGMEAGQANRLFEARAIDNFQKAKQSQEERQAKLAGATAPPAAGNQLGQAPQGQAGALTVKPSEPNQFTTPFTPEADSFAGGKGVAAPSTELGRMAEKAAIQMGRDSLSFREGLNKAIGQAKTPQEIAELRRVAEDSGISDEAFSRQVDTWNKTLNPSQFAKPDWAKDVEKDRTFKGQNMSQFVGMTREEARQKIMKEKVDSFMQQKNKEGASLLNKEQEDAMSASERIAQTRQAELDAKNAKTQILQDSFGTRDWEKAYARFNIREKTDKTRTPQWDKVEAIMKNARVTADNLDKVANYVNYMNVANQELRNWTTKQTANGFK